MKKMRIRRRAARSALSWLRALLAGAALALLGMAQTPAYAAVVPTAVPKALPTAPPVTVPTAPPVALPTAPPVSVSPPPVSVPPVSVPPPPVSVTPPVTVASPPPVSVPPPPVSVPPVNVPPPPVTVATPPPGGTPSVNLPPLPDPSVPNPGGLTQGSSGVPGASGAAGASGSAGAGGAGAAGLARAVILPASLGPAGGLPTGVISASAAIDPSSGIPWSTSPASFTLGEHDYSSAGSRTSLAVDAATGSRAAQAGTPAPSVPMICPQLTFAPLVSGCESVLGPLNGPLGEHLAHSGTPIAIGLAGLFLLGVGGILYRRSSRREVAAAERRMGRLELH